MALERNMNRHIRQCLVLSRILFVVGIGLTVAGGALEGSDTVSDALTGLKLVKTGYIIVVVFVGCLLAVQVYFWTQRSYLSATSKTVRCPGGYMPSDYPSPSRLIFHVRFITPQPWPLHSSLSASPISFCRCTSRPT